MLKLISIDPGKCKCGLVLVDLNKKKVDQAIVLNTEFLPKYVKSLISFENISKVVIYSRFDLKISIGLKNNGDP